MDAYRHEARFTLTHLTMPDEANHMGHVHGGNIIKLMDTAAGVAAMRHGRRLCVTASVDRLDFLRPVYLGELLIINAAVNYTGRTSMEVGVRVEAENLVTGQTRHTASAYLTYVALDDEGRPCAIPTWQPQDEESQRRWREAQIRRDARLAGRPPKSRI